MADFEIIRDILFKLYGNTQGPQAFDRLRPLIEKYTQQPAFAKEFFSEKDIYLITYGDTLQKPNEAPLKSLFRFADQYLKNTVSAIHFLPFFPFSSDDGFSVMDFFTINPDLGTWQDVEPFSRQFDLMFDFVVNHFSARGKWFQNYLDAKDRFQDFAIEINPATDLSMVTRPRSLPLLTEFQKRDHQKVHLWTTFSDDQIDFNFKSLNVLEKMIEVMLFYVAQGATSLRLDAIAYLWKEIGTTCIHLDQTHAMVKLFRAILDVVAPNVIIITETNVPHAENISYFGNGRDEAQMVYNFTLPPLLLHAFSKQDTRVLSDWAQGLDLPSDHTTFFNFTASHDGIGVRPLEGILPAEEIENLCRIVQANDGQVSYKRNSDGTDSPYELNITYIDAILADRSSENAQKFLASQAIQYALPGVPATYIHSLLGTRNWLEGVQQTGRARTINRAQIAIEHVLEDLKDPQSFRSRVFFPYLKLMATRKQQPAFHPNASFEVLPLDARLFVINRSVASQHISAATNISAEPVTLDLNDLGLQAPVLDLIGESRITKNNIQVAPYQSLWLAKEA